MIEALIGAFLISTGYSTTIKFMNWLGLDVTLSDKDGQMMKAPSILPPHLSNIMNNVDFKTYEVFLNQGFGGIEKKIDYSFKNKAYLIAAFTHPSCSNPANTTNYKR